MNQWWTKDKDHHQGIFAHVKYLKQNQAYRTNDNVDHARLYGNMEVLGLTTKTYSRTHDQRTKSRVTYNVVASCVDTLANKIAKNRPKPQFLTEKGKPNEKRKAEKLAKFVEGQFYHGKVYRKGQRCFVDAAVWGTCFLKVFNDGRKVISERVIPEEILCDDADAIHGNPQTLYQVKPVNKAILKSKYPKHASVIDSIVQNLNHSSYNRDEYSETCDVVEAWHLPTQGKDGKWTGGKHVICVDGADLFVEKWERPNYPFAKFMLKPKLLGYWGTGIPEEIVGIQVQINKMLIEWQRADHLLSAPAVFLEKGSEILSSHMNNEIGRIVRFKGMPPQVQPFDVITPQREVQIERLYQKAFEIIGISQLSAQSMKPSGLDSGKALREFNDIESERFALIGQAWENFYMDVADLYIDEAKALKDMGVNLETKSPAKEFVESIKWSDVDMSADKYVMKTFPVSSLSKTPAGRLQEVQEMMQAGLIDPQTGHELLDFPDLKQARSLMFSTREVIRDHVGKMLEDQTYNPPEPFMDLQFAKSYTQSVYNQAKIDNESEETMELLRRFISQADSMLQRAQQAQQEQMMQQQAMMQQQQAMNQSMPTG